MLFRSGEKEQLETRRVGKSHKDKLSGQGAAGSLHSAWWVNWARRRHMKILRCPLLCGFLSSFIQPFGLAHTPSIPFNSLFGCLSASPKQRVLYFFKSRITEYSRLSLFLLIEIGPKMPHFTGILFRLIRGEDSASVALTRVNM